MSSSGEVLRCKGACEDPADVQIVNAAGHNPDPGNTKNLTVNPTNRNVWEISGSQTTLGNLWSRTDAGNFDVLSQTRDLDRQRENVVQDLQAD